MWHIEMYSHGYVNQHNENSIPSEGFFDLCYNHTQKKCRQLWACLRSQKATQFFWNAKQWLYKTKTEAFYSTTEENSHSLILFYIHIAGAT